MIPPNRATVTRLRARVRAVVKASATLSAERKRLRKRRQAHPAAVRAFFALAGPPFLLAGLLVSGALIRVADVFLVWVLAVTMFRAQQFVTLTSDPSTLFVPYTLPLGEDTIFTEHRRLVLRHSCWLALDALVFAILVSFWFPPKAAGWIALPLFVAAHWSVALATAAAIALWRRGLAFATAGTSLLLAFVLLCHVMEKLKIYDAFIAPILTVLRAITPAGWVQTAFIRTITEQSWTGVAALALLTIAALALLQLLLRHLRRGFSLDAVFGEEVPNGRAEDSDDVETVAANAHHAPRFDPGDPAQVATVAARLHEELDQPPGLTLFQRGYLERWIVRTIGPRRRVVVDFLQPAGAWSRGLLIGLGIVVATRLVQMATPADSSVMVGGVGTAILAMWTLPLFGGTWAGFNAVAYERIQIALHAFVPLSFWQIASTALAINLLRILATFPLFVLAAMFCFTDGPLPVLAATDYAVRGLAVVIAVQPWFVLFLFSQHTSDSSARWWITALFILAFVFIVIVAVALVVGMFVGSAWVALTCWATLAALGLGSLAAYGAGWNGRWFDLARVPRQ